MLQAAARLSGNEAAPRYERHRPEQTLTQAALER